MENLELNSYWHSNYSGCVYKIIKISKYRGKKPRSLKNETRYTCKTDTGRIITFSGPWLFRALKPMPSIKGNFYL